MLTTRPYGSKPAILLKSHQWAAKVLAGLKCYTVVVDSLLIDTPIVGFCNCSMFCCALLYVHSNFATILMGKRELAAMHSLNFWCLVIAVWLFLVVP